MSLVPTHGRRRAALALALAAALALLLASAAQATSIGEQIIQRCGHEESLSGYSQSAYREALEELLATTEEYSPCAQQIRQAEIAQAAAHGHGVGGAGQSSAAQAVRAAPLAATPAELRSLAKARKEGSGALSVGGQVVDPGVVHTDVASALSTLPDPLLAVLALMLAVLVASVSILVRNRVRRRRSD